MNRMPITEVGGLKLSRILCGTNWILGYSHHTFSKDRLIKEIMDEKRVVEILCTCIKNGINAVMGPPSEFLVNCIEKAKEKMGKDLIYICTPWKIEEVEWAKEKGAKICMPHTSVTDTIGIDVETYIQIYNPIGFLCNIEVEWIYKIINEAKKPVMIIKPFAGGRITPFVVNTIRDIDMITIGFSSPYEVDEDVEIFLSIIEKRKPELEYQITRSKKSLEK